MAKRKSLAWSELKVGIMVIISFAVLTFAVVRIGGQTSLFSRKVTITAYFPSANGLRPGAEIWLDGILVGNVETVTINKQPEHKGKVAVVMKIDERYASGVRTDSTIGIDTIGLLGDKNIQLASGTDKGMPIDDGGSIEGAEVGDIRRIITGVDDLVGNFKVLSDKIISISDSVDQGEGTLGKLLTKSEIHDNLNNAVMEMQKLVADVRTGPGTTGKLINDDALYQRLNDTVGRIDNIAARMDRGEGSAGKMLNDPELYNKMDRMLARMDGIAAHIERGDGTLGKLINDEGLYTDMRKTVNRVDGLISAIETGDGTAGKLIKDPTLFNTMNQAASEIQKLLYDIKQDPKKYLSISVRLF